MDLKNWEWMFALSAVFVTIAAFTPTIDSARSDDERASAQNSENEN
jgi:hypothetical protein